MSSKATICMFESQTPGGVRLHMYSQCFSDMVSLDVNFGLDLQMSVSLPLPFVLEMARRLQDHVRPIEDLLEASEPELEVRAKLAAMRMRSSKMFDLSHMSLEELEHDELQRLKDLREEYRRALNG
jgi:hypothetical protein